LSAYPTSSSATQLILNAETWKLAYISSASYEYIQFETLKCTLPFSNCDASCSNSSQPHFILNGVCQFCHYSCLSCQTAASTTACDTCSSTRTLNPSTHLCDCIAGYYDPLQSNYTCTTCFPCLACPQNSLLCLTCHTELHMVLNNVLSTCECSLGYFPNYLVNTNTFNSTAPCLPCPVNCLLCTNASFCLACNLITYLTNGSCFLVCAVDQAYRNGSCVSVNSGLFDQNGRMGFDFTYLSVQSVINFTLTFSQPDVLFYYYENETGYSWANSQGGQAQSQSSVFYFDDGSYALGGYSSSTGQQVIPSAPIAALSGNSSMTTASSQSQNQFNFNLIRTSDINGSYLGLSEQYYYYLAYYFE
jgi:hypothetical protein